MQKRSTPDTAPEPRGEGRQVCRRLLGVLTKTTVSELLEPYKERYTGNEFALPQMGFTLEAASEAFQDAVFTDGKKVKVACVGMFSEHCDPFAVSIDAYHKSASHVRTGVLPRLRDAEATFSRRDMLHVAQTMVHSELWLAKELAAQFCEIEDMQANATGMQRALAWLESMPTASIPGACALCDATTVCKREALPPMIQETCTCKDAATGALTCLTCHSCTVRAYTTTGRCTFCRGS